MPASLLKIISIRRVKGNLSKAKNRLRYSRPRLLSSNVVTFLFFRFTCSRVPNHSSVQVASVTFRRSGGAT